MVDLETRRRNVRDRLRAILNDFCGECSVDKTRRKFFNQAVGAIVMSGRLVVSKWCRWVHDNCRERFYRQKRLLNQLHSDDWDPAPLLSAYQRWAGQFVQHDTPLLVDLTDLAKPRARKLKYLAHVRDGSDPDHRLVPGYWCIQVYARLAGNRPLPLVLHPYSIDDPAVLSENQQILNAVEEAREATDGRGVLVIDRGGDRIELLGPWTTANVPFVVRQRGDRIVLLEGDPQAPAGARPRVTVRELAEKLVQQAGTDKPAWCRVYLPEYPDKPLTLVCRQSAGFDAPLMLLTNLAVPSEVQARNVLLYYRQRWSCEEAVEWLKQAVGLERFAIRTYESFPRLFMLAAWAMAFLTLLLMKPGRLAYAVKEATRKRPGYRQIKFHYYRLLNSLQDLMFTLSFTGAPRPPPRNG